MSHPFEHVRRLVFMAIPPLHPHMLVIPIVPPLCIELQSGPPLVFSYPKRYAAPNELHGVRGEIVIEFVFPF